MTAAKIRLTQPVFLMRYSATRSGKAAAPFQKIDRFPPGQTQQTIHSPILPPKALPAQGKAVDGDHHGQQQRQLLRRKAPLGTHKRRKQRQRQKQAKPNGEKEHRVTKRLPEHGSAPQLPEILQPRKVRVRHPLCKRKKHADRKRHRIEHPHPEQAGQEKGKGWNDGFLFHMVGNLFEIFRNCYADGQRKRRHQGQETLLGFLKILFHYNGSSYPKCIGSAAGRMGSASVRRCGNLWWGVLEVG